MPTVIKYGSQIGKLSIYPSVLTMFRQFRCRIMSIFYSQIELMRYDRTEVKLLLALIVFIHVLADNWQSAIVATTLNL